MVATGKTAARSGRLRGLLAGRGWLVAALLLAVACDPEVGDGGAFDGACPTGGAGTLRLTVEGLPAGTRARVLVTDPLWSDRATYEVEAGTEEVVSFHAGGPVWILPSAAATGGGILRDVHLPLDPLSSVCVGEDTAFTLRYEPTPRSGRLWAANDNGDSDLNGFDAGLLRESGSPEATVAASLRMGDAIAFDPQGNLWTASGSRVFRIPASRVFAGGPWEPDFELEIAEAACLSSIVGMAFAPDGMLVVVTPCGEVVSIDPAGSSGDPETFVVHVARDDLSEADAVVYVRDGFWVAHEGGLARFFEPGGAGFVVEEAGSSMAVERADGWALSASAMAIDADGNLWAADFAGNVLYRLPTTTLWGPGPLVPDIEIRLDVSSLLEGMAFDEEGGLWLNGPVGDIVRLSPSQLEASTGTGEVLRPDRVLTSPDVRYSTGLAAFPAPAWSPLFHALP